MMATWKITITETPAVGKHYLLAGRFFVGQWVAGRREGNIALAIAARSLAGPPVRYRTFPPKDLQSEVAALRVSQSQLTRTTSPQLFMSPLLKRGKAK